MTRRTQSKGCRGFSLIELMVVVAVLGILASIAVPSYQDYVLRSKLVDAVSSLSQLRVSMEQYYQDQRSYDAVPAEPAGSCGLTVSDGNSKYFTYSCSTSNDGQDFLITATGTAGGGTAAFAYTVNQVNERKTTAMPDGWSSDTKCWITTRGQGC